jgi:hypothetical protein
MSGFDKPTRLAGEVLRSAIDQDWRRCERYMARLNDECDSGGLGFALVAWCDALAEHAHDGMPKFGKVRVMDVDQDSGAALTEDIRTPQIRWCNRLIAARAAGDKEAFSALLDDLNTVDDGHERGRYASALIQAVAGTIRTYPRGYALMGRSPTGS